jgi:hypothetical protein
VALGQLRHFLAVVVQCQKEMHIYKLSFTDSRGVDGKSYVARELKRLYS